MMLWNLEAVAPNTELVVRASQVAEQLGADDCKEDSVQSWCPLAEKNKVFLAWPVSESLSDGFVGLF